MASSATVASPGDHLTEYCGFTPGGSAYCWRWVPVDMNGVTHWVLGDPGPIPALPPPEAGASE